LVKKNLKLFPLWWSFRLECNARTCKKIIEPMCLVPQPDHHSEYSISISFRLTYCST